MNKIWIVIQREYLSRVKKKSFLIMTFLGPILMGGIFAAVFLLEKVDSEVKTVTIIDETHIFKGKFKSTDRIVFEYADLSLDSARKLVKQSGKFAVLHIPATDKLSTLEKAATLYSESQPGLDVVSRIKFTIEKEINTQKYIQAGIDEKKLNEIKTDVDIRTMDLENKETSTPLTSGLGFAGGLLIYLFIFIYGAMVMRGVLEEKTNRIVEVIISSVKPFQLMMGKIVGVAMVGLTQFLLWVVLSTVVYSTFTSVMLKDRKEQVKNMIKANTAGDQELEEAMDEVDIPDDAGAKLTQMIGSINLPLLMGMFIFYFLGGYLLYSALFAAVGAAVDSETDTQQFMLPVTIPLAIAYIAAAMVMNNPQSNIALWFSLIPFTSPIVMMVRIPFGVPWPEVALSMVLLVCGFILTTWLAGRIYRTGILMYGKKVSYKELWKWIRYHH